MTARFLSESAAGIAVLTGSVPPGVAEDYYRRLVRHIKAQGGRAVVDAHGAELKQALDAGPWLVRLNQYVLEMNIKRRLGSIEEVARAAREMQQRGVEMVCISIGNNGSILADSENSYHCAAPRVRVHSTVGCGDALLAGLVAAAHRGEGTQAMLRLGVICGSATAAHQGTELFTREEIEVKTDGLELTTLDI
jgi:6-phosphofructokinase 2